MMTPISHVYIVPHLSKHWSIIIMMSSSNENIFRVTGHLCGEFTGHRSPVNSPHKSQWRGAFMFSLICAWINRLVNNRETGDLRRYRAHYGVIVMIVFKVIVEIIVWYDMQLKHDTCYECVYVYSQSKIYWHIYSFCLKFVTPAKIVITQLYQTCLHFNNSLYSTGNIPGEQYPSSHPEFILLHS